ncbi:MAG: S28 family serine protease [Proteobacteria bacterium]|nr:S28 family serine protease [Pseudomonadota bacterium]
MDHNDPDGPSFEQKLVLFHSSYTAPLVLQTSGYQIFGSALTNVARKFSANQIQVEHRFFGSSVPSLKDWSKLNIRQSAADFHRITQAFKPHYTGKWLNTGASKGGMTSVFHRRFYPADLDGTLAVVAPLSYSTADERFVDFVDQVGGDNYQPCRIALEEFQGAVLASKSQILPQIKGSYSTLGSASVALEHAVFEAAFAFWQYGTPESTTAGCDKIPAPTASPTKLLEFLGKVNGVESSYSDTGMEPFVSYYVQAAQQLGSPGAKLTHLSQVAEHQGTYRIESYIPSEASKVFDSNVMPEIQSWVQGESERIMFIYGEYDPWTAGKYTPGSADRDNYLYVAPKGNHGSNVDSLSSADKAKAWDTITRWLGMPPEVAATGVATATSSSTRGDISMDHRVKVETLEELEFNHLRKNRIAAPK